jgi:molecular chaperone GrpE
MQEDISELSRWKQMEDEMTRPLDEPANEETVDDQPAVASQEDADHEPSKDGPQSLDEPAERKPGTHGRHSSDGRKSVDREQYDQLKAERDQLLDRLARLQAEFENARKRGEREKAANRDYAVASVVEKFLPVMDHFEMALKADGTADQLRTGVELIVKQMEDVLRQLQVTAIPAVGVEFDPRVHEALGTVERDDMPDHHVAEEIRRGYKLRDKLLRPSMVRVASNPKQTNE